MNKISILKTVGGYRVSSEVGGSRYNFFVVDEDISNRIKELEKLCLEVIKLQVRTNVIKNITNIDIIETEETKRINVSVDTLTLEGVLIESNHRYSFSIKEKLKTIVTEMEDTINEKVYTIKNVR